ncbi:transcriptional regulator [Bacillus cereus]|nr:transcriptional regulator [Bacillus cereus]PFJ51348.1 transcriptional regulator [Bacillus cereus]PFW17245.1 transcriptional regulator [Bacillus cereus]PGX05581.1 transcriptional regulator [Bacillus cereus]PGY24305.1 transcriptional regulator [Bacillus cereus]
MFTFCKVLFTYSLKMDIINVTNLQKGDFVYLIQNKVKQFRVVRDITQEQLASSVQITRQSLIAIEKNKYNPSLELALNLCEFFNCKVEDLFQLDKTGEEKE